MELVDILKVYGPLGLGWIGFAYVGQFILKRYDADIKAKTDLAIAISKLADRVGGGNRE